LEIAARSLGIWKNDNKIKVNYNFMYFYIFFINSLDNIKGAMVLFHHGYENTGWRQNSARPCRALREKDLRRPKWTAGRR
jgi:hypothetical protein